MKTLEELHRAYMREKDIDNAFEAQQINEYYNSTDDDIAELAQWKPVAKPKVSINEIIKMRGGQNDKR